MLNLLKIGQIEQIFKVYRHLENSLNLFVFFGLKLNCFVNRRDCCNSACPTTG